LIILSFMLILSLTTDLVEGGDW